MQKGIKSGFAIWLTGLPSSGKTTIAKALKNLLLKKVAAVQVLDSDDLRQKLTPHPTYSPKERDWFYDMVTFLAELLTDNGVNVIIAATASRRTYRRTARSRIKRFAEVYIDCSPDVCRARDSKGLWKKAGKGEIGFLPGGGAPFEPPESPEVRLDTAELSIDVAARTILNELNKKGFFSP